VRENRKVIYDELLREYGDVEGHFPFSTCLGGGSLSYDKDSLIRLFNMMAELKEGVGWVSKGRIDDALKEWSREDRLQYSLLMEAMSDLENIEKY